MDEIYTLTNVLVKSKQEGITKSQNKYWKFTFVNEDEEIKMNCFEYDVGKDIGAGDNVDIDYLSKGGFKNVKAFRPSSQHFDLDEPEELLEEDPKEPIYEEEVVLDEPIDGPKALGKTNEILVEEKPKEIIKEKPSSIFKSPTNRNNKDINKDFIVNIQGKDFITINGLLAIADNEGGIERIEVTNLDVNLEKQSAYATVKVTMKDGRVFENGGSGMPANLKANMQKNFVEMSISRALARSIRFGLSVDYVCGDELNE